MLKAKGLRRRWLTNTIGVICALGLVCVLVVTATFAAYYYAAMESDLRLRADATSEFFASVTDQSDYDVYQNCITYVQNFEQLNDLELQFISANGDMVASSGDSLTGQFSASDVQKAVETGEIVKFTGRDPLKQYKHC